MERVLKINWLLSFCILSVTARVEAQEILTLKDCYESALNKSQLQAKKTFILRYRA